MMSKEFLKKLGIVGITFGLSASPLVLAGDTTGEEDSEVYPEETAPGDANTQHEAFDTLEYENEEEEWETTGDDTTTGNDWEEENEEEEWEDDSDTDQNF